MGENELNDLLAKLTLGERVSLLSGADGWQTQEISRLGIGSLKVSAASIALSRAYIY
jgi:beta-glucosidase